MQQQKRRNNHDDSTMLAMILALQLLILIRRYILGAAVDVSILARAVDCSINLKVIIGAT